MYAKLRDIAIVGLQLRKGRNARKWLWCVCLPQSSMLYAECISYCPYSDNNFNRLGQYEKAKTYLEQALFIHQEVGNRRGECRTTRDLGKSSRMLGQKKQALAYYQRALNISEEIQDPFGKATTLQNAALLYIDQTQYEVALSCLLIAKNIFDEILSPYSNPTQKSIDTLQKTIGEEQFTALLTQVEPQAQQIVDQALRETDNK